MNYKLVAFDLDGTLLDSKGNIPQRNADALRAVYKKGVKLLAVTGRSDILAKDYIEELGMDIPVVGCNGASMSDVITGKVFYTAPIDKAIVKTVINACIELDTPCKALSADTCYTSDDEMFAKGIKQIVTSYTRELKYGIDYKKLTNESMLEMSENTEVLKLVTVQNDIDRLIKLQSRLSGINGLRVLRSNINCLDMVAENISKGNAFAKYAVSLGISTDECIAFGDNENDISMLETAGLGVAMANAAADVKAAADFVTLTNDECGVAAVLEKEFALNG